MAIQRSGRFERIKKPLKSDMNVVPYIDVMLVLLVIFMVTAPMITSGIKVDLPQATNTPIETKEPAIVTLGQDGNIYLQYKEHNKEQVSLSQLKEILGDAQTQADESNQKITVLVNGEKTRPYGDVVSLMSSLQEAGLTQVGLLTEPLK
ncbi:protein TolR [Acinetobacter ursingii]|jgi:biopolymer transport protein TolR|uniref:Tol-Pal system protein TolR n=1 Tax=Acinetobacter ursingii TaxID=108980 RepID=A0A3F3LBP0_9GAMM|nr:MULTISPECIES: protein TolR [Acinetobacter]ENX48374.1 protein TolR [Acinetobacter ursingii NIPH 706]EXD37582.1 protein TolR [Acinetobacter sp. 479375]MCU4482264.1 protein TolR [Acinetobacter ursingii]MCU4489540.1 protein TolR [Acinetobacter ursingii]MCU4497836.1 protein TolR [Acinetobacter ursingii]